MKFLISLFVLVLSLARSSSAQIEFGEGTSISFATAEEGREVLTARDDFVERMSPFDRSVRLRSEEKVTEAEYLEFVSQHVLDWDEMDKKTLTDAIEGVRESIEALKLPLPEKIVLVKTSGEEEGGAAYTRGNAIVLPVERLQLPLARLQSLFCHELFHVISRADPEFRERLYSSIGFEKCQEIEFPPQLAPRKITNPDAPRNDHWIRLKLGDEEILAVPILFSIAEQFDPKVGSGLFEYLQFEMLVVEQLPDSGKVAPVFRDDEPRLVSLTRASGFFDQVGRNTSYIIHPEEILAENFAMIVLNNKEPVSPEVQDRIREALAEPKE